MFKDWRGVEIGIGDIVVYPSRQSSSLWMNEGVVVSLSTVPHTWDNTKVVPVIGIKKSRSSGWRGAKQGKRISYPEPNRMTVVCKGNSHT